MRSTNGALGAVIGIVLGALHAASAGIAVAGEAAHGPFSVERAELEGLAGTLEVRVVEGGESRLTITGPDEAIAALEVGVDAGVLSVTAPPRGNAVTVVDRVTVVTGSGASSNVVIGGSSAATSSASGNDAAALAIVLEVPAGTGLALLGFTGEAEIGDISSAVVIQAVGGTVRLGAITDAELVAIGKGRVEAASVEGDLAAAVTGDGSITVAGGSIGMARVDTTGSGEVVIEAPARSAAVNMVGNGTVRMADVAEAPEVSRVGAGQFSVGPR
jgi:hypothetical protein